MRCCRRPPTACCRSHAAPTCTSSPRTGSLGAAGWNLFGRDEIDAMLRDGTELAAATGARAVELRGRVLRLGSNTEDSPEALTTEQILAATEAVLPELEALGDARATASALCTLAWTEATMGRAGDAVATIRRALA